MHSDASQTSRAELAVEDVDARFVCSFSDKPGHLSNDFFPAVALIGMNQLMLWRWKNETSTRQLVNTSTPRGRRQNFPLRVDADGRNKKT